MMRVHVVRRRAIDRTGQVVGIKRRSGHLEQEGGRQNTDQPGAAASELVALEEAPSSTDTFQKDHRSSLVERNDRAGILNCSMSKNANHRKHDTCVPCQFQANKIS